MPRTRSKEAHESVIEAAIALFSERGLDDTSMDAIAKLANVSKATLYKHWPNKNSLCLEALSLLFGLDTTVSVPDTGDLRADLIAGLRYEPSEEWQQLRDQIMPHVIAYAAKNAEFAKAWRNRAMSPLITALTDWIKREQVRGSLKRGIEMESAIAMLVGPLLFRKVFHQREYGESRRFAPELEERIADWFLAVHMAAVRR